MRTKLYRVIRGVCGAAMVACSTGVVLAEPADRFQLSPGVVVDKGAGRIYVMQRGRTPGTAALEVQTGKVLWINSSAVRPLEVTADHRVVSQCRAEEAGENALYIEAIDGETGKTDFRARLELPDGVSPSEVDTPSGRFAASAVTVEGETVLRWRFSPRNTLRALPPGTLSALPGGAAETPPPVAFERKIQSGGFRLNLETQESAPIEEGAAIDETPPAFDEEAGPPLPDVAAPQYLSADGRHVIASRRTDKEGPRFVLSVYDRASKEKVGEIPSESAYVPFYVDDSRIVLQTAPFARRVGEKMIGRPREVRVVDLKSAEHLWSHAIREVEFRGAPPP